MSMAESACHISSPTSVNGSRGIRARQNEIQDPKDIIQGHLVCRPTPMLSSDIRSGLMARDTFIHGESKHQPSRCCFAISNLVK